MRVAIIGGGINGIMTAWEFTQRGCQVELFEKHKLMQATSSASTKMLHGGIRYLEQGQFALVRESLRERSWWLKQAPALSNPIEILIPVYVGHNRPKWLLGLGVRLYELLAFGYGLPKGRWYSVEQVVEQIAHIRTDGLIGAYSYWDGQMDDYNLGVWAATQAINAGLVVHENTEVTGLSATGNVTLASGEAKSFDHVINVAGPWAAQLIERSTLESKFKLDLIRGSHVLLPGVRSSKGCVLQVPREKRILFVLPFQGKTLLGTTEIRQNCPEPMPPEQCEVDYLLSTYNRFFAENLTADDVIERFSGVRPIVATKSNFSAASRESVIEQMGQLVNVFGGKWTTSRSLAKSIVNLVLN